ARESDIMTVTVTTDASGSEAFPYINYEWLKPGALLLHPAAVRYDDEFFTSGDARMVVDSWRLYDAWADEYANQAYENLVIEGTHWQNFQTDGKVQANQIEENADIATGTIPPRQNAEEIILYSAGVMRVEDVARATDIYRNAVEKN